MAIRAAPGRVVLDVSSSRPPGATPGGGWAGPSLA